MNLDEILARTGLTLEELIKIVDDRIHNGILVKENAELKETLMKFADDLATFQTLVNTTMSESKRLSSEMIGKNSEMLNQKIASLLTSNQQLESSIESKIQGFAKEMTSLVDRQKERFDSMAKSMAAASNDYASKVQADMRKTHREHTQYLRSLDSRNVARTLYLAITPALILLDFLSRSFGWF